jgi:hypothetical protein
MKHIKTYETKTDASYTVFDATKKFKNGDLVKVLNKRGEELNTIFIVTMTGMGGSYFCEDVNNRGGVQKTGGGWKTAYEMRLLPDYEIEGNKYNL